MCCRPGSSGRAGRCWLRWPALSICFVTRQLAGVAGPIPLLGATVGIAYGRPLLNTIALVNGAGQPRGGGQWHPSASPPPSSGRLAQPRVVAAFWPVQCWHLAGCSYARQRAHGNLHAEDALMLVSVTARWSRLAPAAHRDPLL